MSMQVSFPALDLALPTAPLWASAWHWFFGILLFASSLFLILLVLVQRGRGGGLTGALGGMGGQSAFGTKAGDLFTRITMVTAAVWLLLCLMAVKVLTSSPSGPFGSASGGGTTSNVVPSKAADDGKAAGDGKAGAAAGAAAGGSEAPAGAAPSDVSGASGGTAPAATDASKGGSTSAPAGDAKP